MPLCLKDRHRADQRSFEHWGFGASSGASQAAVDLMDFGKQQPVAFNVHRIEWINIHAVEIQGGQTISLAKRPARVVAGSGAGYADGFLSDADSPCIVVLNEFW